MDKLDKLDKALLGKLCSKAKLSNKTIISHLSQLKLRDEDLSELAKRELVSSLAEYIIKNNRVDIITSDPIGYIDCTEILVSGYILTHTEIIDLINEAFEAGQNSVGIL